MRKDYQVAAIPVRRTQSGAIEVLLVTSRETRRWVVPKGWPWHKHKDHRAAAGEAWEEAGVKGRALPDRLGTFSYEKRLKNETRQLEVVAYLLEVEEVAESWPEARERSREWFSPDEAALRVDEPELRALLLALAER